MTIKEITAKILKGEELTDAEKAFLQSYDPDKEKNDAAAAARRKAEEDAQAAKAELAKVQKAAEDAKAAADDAKKASMTEAQKRDAEFKSLQETVAKLTKERDAEAAKSAAALRSQAIRDAAKAAGIGLAPKTVSESLFHQMIEAQLAGVDISDATKLKERLDLFKSENPGIIAAPGSGSGVQTGAPSSRSGKNPWAKESFNLTEQVLLARDNPVEARRLAAEAGTPLE